MAEIPACLLFSSLSEKGYLNAIYLKDLEGSYFSIPQKVILLLYPKNLQENKSCAGVDSISSSLAIKGLGVVNFFIPKALKKLLR